MIFFSGGGIPRATVHSILVLIRIMIRVQKYLGEFLPLWRKFAEQSVVVKMANSNVD